MPSNANTKRQKAADIKKEKQDIFVEGDPALDQSTAKSTFNQSLKPQKLAYLAEMLLELKKISSEIDEPMTTYLIEMAYLEATTAKTIGDFNNDLKE